MQNQKIKRDPQEKNETHILLREDLDDYNSLPKTFNINEGTTTDIKTNIYPITYKNSGSKLFQYSVETDPPFSNQKQLSHIIYNSFNPENDKSIDNKKNNQIIFDGTNTIFSSLHDLEGEKSITDKFDQSKSIKISVKLVKEINSDDFGTLIHLYQIVFRKAYKSIGLTKFGKKWLDDQDIKQVGNFKIIGGFKPSLIALSCGISFVVYNTYRIDRQGNLYDYLKRGISNPAQRSELTNALKEMRILTSHLKEQRVIKISSIDWNSNPSQTTFEMTNKNNSQTTKISIADYFQQFHNFTVQRDDPLIETVFNINGEQRIDLFPSSCLIISGITEAEKKDENLMSELAQATSMPIAAEKQKLDAFISKMKKKPETNEMFTRWGIQFNDSLNVVGRILHPPKILFRTRQSDHAEIDIQTNSQICFRNEIRNVGIALPPRINAVPLVVSPSSCLPDIKQTFVPKILELSKEIGISFLNPDLLEIDSISQNSYRKAILDYILQKGTPSFIIVVFPDVNKERYDAVKQLLTVDLGIPSQFVKSSTLFNKTNTESTELINSRLFTNICLKLLYQITAKTGGICYYVSPSTLPLNNTMIVGIDVEKSKYDPYSSVICAMTASYDQTLARYYSDTFIISKSQSKSKSGGISSSNSLVFNKEKEGFSTVPSDYISDFISRAVERYIKQRSCPPKRIIVYRSGVSYSQMKNVKQEEVKAITDIIDSSISLVYMIVQTNNNFKFTMINNSPHSQNPNSSERTTPENKTGSKPISSEDDNFDCPKAGTIVTENINAYGIPEFYLVSNEICNINNNNDLESLSLYDLHQSSLTKTEKSAIFNNKAGNRKAMVTPTKYTIIHHFPAVWSDEKLAMLTHYLTCEYPNWQGSIRIPCPLMLASKLAELSRSCLNSQKPNESLSDCLHFI